MKNLQMIQRQTLIQNRQNTKFSPSKTMKISIHEEHQYRMVGFGSNKPHVVIFRLWMLMVINFSKNLMLPLVRNLELQLKT